MFTAFVLAQVTISSIAGVKASPREDADIQAFMWGEASVEAEACPVGPWIEVGGGVWRYTGHEAKIPANPFNLEAGRYLAANWFARGGLQYCSPTRLAHDRPRYSVRLGARFGRRMVDALGHFDEDGWAPEHRLPADPNGPEQGYHAELVPFVEAQLDWFTFRSWGPVLIRQGNTLPRPSVMTQVAATLDEGRIELFATYTSPRPVVTGDSIVLSDGTVIDRVASGELVPATLEIGMGRWIVISGHTVLLAVTAGTSVHPAWRGKYQGVNAIVAFSPGTFFRKRQRSVGVYR